MLKQPPEVDYRLGLQQLLRSGFQTLRAELAEPRRPLARSRTGGMTGVAEAIMRLPGDQHYGQAWQNTPVNSLEVADNNLSLKTGRFVA